MCFIVQLQAYAFDFQVHIATLTFSIGQVRLEVSSAAASTDDHDSFLLPLLLSLVVCLLIFVFCAVVLIWWAKRGPGGTKMAAVKPEPEPQAIPDADSEDVTDAGSLPPMPVQSVFGHTRITGEWLHRKSRTPVLSLPCTIALGLRQKYLAKCTWICDTITSLCHNFIGKLYHWWTRRKQAVCMLFTFQTLLYNKCWLIVSLRCHNMGMEHFPDIVSGGPV